MPSNRSQTGARLTRLARGAAGPSPYAQARQQIGLIRPGVGPSFPSGAPVQTDDTASGISAQGYWDPYGQLGGPGAVSPAAMAAGAFEANGATAQLMVQGGNPNPNPFSFAAAPASSQIEPIGTIPGSVIMYGTISNDQLAQPSPPISERVQTFIAGGTWTKPKWATLVQVTAIAGGGGGGGGERVATSLGGPNAGGGGGGGGLTYGQFDAADLPSTVAVTVGAGGTAGAQQTTNHIGAAGGDGGASSFGSYLTAGGGKGGPAGDHTRAFTPSLNTALGGSGSGVGGYGGHALNGSGTNGNTDPNSGTLFATQNVPGGGGGGAGGVNTSGIGFSGGFGGMPTSTTGTVGAQGVGDGGTGFGSNAGDGSGGSATNSPSPGTGGGGGGGGDTDDDAGHGGAGGAGGGGGGGGGGAAASAPSSVLHSGAGGAGGRGVVTVVCQ